MYRLSFVFIFLLNAFLNTSCNQSRITGDTNIVFSSKIVGVDNRYPVENTLELPYRAVGRIVSFGGGGTGTLIYKNIVLTAAHVAKSYATSFVPALQKKLKPYGEIKISRIVYAKKYLKHDCVQGITDENRFYCFHNDFAFLILEKSIGDEIGTLKLSPVSEEQDWRLRFNSIGYGADSSRVQKTQNEDCEGALFYRTKEDYGLQAEDSDLNGQEIGSVLLNNCDAKHGDSGSPLITYDLVDAELPTIAGIQVTANTDKTTPDWNKFSNRTSSEFY